MGFHSFTWLIGWHRISACPLQKAGSQLVFPKCGDYPAPLFHHPFSRSSPALEVNPFFPNYKITRTCLLRYDQHSSLVQKTYCSVGSKWSKKYFVGAKVSPPPFISSHEKQVSWGLTGGLKVTQIHSLVVFCCAVSGWTQLSWLSSLSFPLKYACRSKINTRCHSAYFNVNWWRVFTTSGIKQRGTHGINLSQQAEIAAHDKTAK